MTANDGNRDDFDGHDDDIILNFYLSLILHNQIYCLCCINIYINDK